MKPLTAGFLCLAWWFESAIAEEVSPYVETRLEDPISWRAWSNETRTAFAASGKPGLVSVSHELNGLSGAMSKESFRNEDIAKRIDEGFFPIAIDKNAHPQLAEQLAIYVWKSKQIAGWPLTVFVTPDFKPIDGGGYYPPTDDWGNQGLSSIVNALNEQWTNSGEIVRKKAEEGLEELSSFHGLLSNPSESFDPKWLDVAVENLAFQFDEMHGGFGLPPKPVSFSFMRLLELASGDESAQAEQAIAMRRKTLPALLRGTLRDYVRGGFFAAATEASWSIPDFRKLATVQANAINYLYNKNEYRDVANGAARCLIEDFRLPNGLFCEQVAIVSPSFDENTANTWTYDELSSILEVGELEAFTKRFGVSEKGNVPEELDVSGLFEGRNILRTDLTNDGGDLQVEASLEKLRNASQSRFARQQESLVSVRINAVIASALLKLEGPYRETGLELVDQVIDTFWDPSSNRLWSAAKNNRPVAVEASSKDYAWFTRMLLDTAEVQSHGREDRLKLAVLAQSILDQRFSSESGPYWVAPVGSNLFPIPLFAFLEDALGSTNSLSVSNLNRLNALYPNKGYIDKLNAILNHLPEEITYATEQYPDFVLAALSVQE